MLQVAFVSPTHAVGPYSQGQYRKGSWLAFSDPILSVTTTLYFRPSAGEKRTFHKPAR